MTSNWGKSKRVILDRWLGNVLYKRVRESHGEILNNQIHKGAEKYENPLPGNWTAKQLIRHGKEENVDQFVYYEALEIVVEQMEVDLREAIQRAETAEKALAELQVTAERERRKWAGRGR